MAINATDKYIQTVNAYADHLVGNNEAIEQLVELFNRKGEEYFGSHRSGYIRTDPEDIVDGFKKHVYNKAQFLNKKRKNEGHDDDATEEDVIFMDEASFDDSFRHTIFIDVSDVEQPKLVEPPAGLLRDSVLRWITVESLPELFPDGNTIAVHLDMMTQIFFPIPTKKKSGGKRRRKTRKIRKH
jgi:hypothetical protein